MLKQLVRLASRVYNVPLAIDPSKLDVILTVLGPRIGWPEAVVVEDPTEVEETGERKTLDVGEDGIAVIDISGTMVSRTGGVDAMSGLTSYESIENRMVMAAMDPAVRGVMLRIDSPGGETSGAFDLADLIAGIAKEKPVWAIADQSALSAGYLIASQVQRIYTTRTSGVGGIGVIAVHADKSAADKAQGVKYTTLYFGKRKNDLNPHEPLNDDTREWLQSEVDRLGEMFVTTVARGRPIDAAAVRATEAGRFFGESAVEAGLADRVGTFTEAMRDMASAMNESSESQSAVEGGITVKDNESVTEAVVDEAKSPEDKEHVTDASDLAAVVSKANDDGYAKASEIADLCTIAGKPQLAADFITNRTPADKVRGMLLEGRVSGEGEEIHSHVSPGDGKEGGAVTKDNPVLKAVEANNARDKK